MSINLFNIKTNRVMEKKYLNINGYSISNG